MFYNNVTCLFEGPINTETYFFLCLIVANFLNILATQVEAKLTEGHNLFKVLFIIKLLVKLFCDPSGQTANTLSLLLTFEAVNSLL